MLLSAPAEVLPDSVCAWDDASNNRWIIVGAGSAIFNPPSAWAVAKRDNPDAARHLWHCDAPHGPDQHAAGQPQPRGQGDETCDDAISWAENELEGVPRG